VNSALDLPNAQHPEPNLWTGGQLSSRDLTRLGALGITTAIDLRGRGEPQPFHPPTAFAQHDVAYVQIPVEGGGDLSKQNAAKLAEAIDASSGGVVVYCASGNRVGALFACHAKWYGELALDEAIAIGNARGLRQMEPMVRQILTLSP